MKLTNLLISKNFGLSKNINFDKESIVFNDINVILSLNNWKYSDLKDFKNFIAEYNFPDHREFKKKDKEAVRNFVPEPQVLLQNEENRIAIYLIQKKQLTGTTLLHLRSINKFEQMEIKYFIKCTNAPINNPKIYRTDFFEFCQSSDIYFDYSFINDSKINSAKLRIITCGFNEYILLIYAFDKNQNLAQYELDNLIQSIKTNI